MLRGGEWLLATARFGQVRVVPQSVRELRGTALPQSPPPGDGEERPMTAAHCELIGENRIAGGIDLPGLHLAAAKSTTEPDPKKIMRIEREGGDDGAEATIKVKLADGQEMSGRLTESVLPIRSGARVWRVPVAHLVSVNVPPPEKLAAPPDPAKEEVAPCPAEPKS